MTNIPKDTQDLINESLEIAGDNLPFLMNENKVTEMFEKLKNKNIE